MVRAMLKLEGGSDMSGFYQSTPPSEVFLMHFNPFHDRKNGQFTSKSGEVSSGNVKPKKMWNQMSKEEQDKMVEREIM